MKIPWNIVITVVRGAVEAFLQKKKEEAEQRERGTPLGLQDHLKPRYQDALDHVLKQAEK